MRHYLTALLLALSPSLAMAQRDAKVPDPDPELERKTFIVPKGFEVTLWAADPLLAKPIQMNFDPQGRLWVATSEVYPQIKPGQKANDKIIILEDKNNDGKADKTTVFADGLLIPTGIEPGDGGAYVANSTELVHLSASKPGQKADRKKILLSGFGTEDTHHIIHTFRWGPDCRLYFNQSIYIHSHIETPSGVKRLNAGGIWRFNPDKCELDIFARGWINPWGHAFDKYGQSFATDGANGEGINHVIPGGYYPTAQGPHTQRTLHGLNPGSPKHCGLEIISGRHFPPEWDGDCITCDFRGHRVCRFKLSDDGSTFASREMTEVIKSNHPAFRPIDVKMGPDGALYIADWYNPIIQHGEVDFRDPRRDKTHGRIWRVTAKNRPLVKKPDLVNMTVKELLDQLKAPEQWTRQQAKRVLKERGAEKVIPELETWIKALDLKHADYERYLLEATWVAVGADQAIGEMVRLLAAKDPGVRAAVIRVCSCRMLDFAGFPELVAKGVQNVHPRVRLEAVRGLSGGHSTSVEAALKALDMPMDRTLDYALWLTIRELEPYWLPDFQAGKLTFGGDAKKIAFALSAAANKDTVKPVVALIESGKLPKENVQGMWLLLAQIGGPEELGKVLTHAAEKSLPARERGELLTAVEETVRTRKVGAPAMLNELIALLPAIGEQSASVWRLIGRWKAEKYRVLLEKAAGDGTLSTAERTAALDGLVYFGDAKAKQFITGLCSTNTGFGTAFSAIEALTFLDTPLAAEKAVAWLTSARPLPEMLDLFAAFVNRKGGARVLAKALAGKKLDPDVAKIGLKAVRASGQKADALVAVLMQAGGLGAAKKPPTPEKVKALTAEAMKSGDAARGEAVYRRKDLQCMACHAYAGAGGQVGPDLTSIGASAQPDYLVESLLLPSKAIKEGYHAMRVVTADEKVLQGVKVREADGKLVLRTAEDKEIIIPTKDIIERGQAMKSLMPEGQTETLTKQDFADLVKYLSELGKVGGAYAPSKARVVRRWQLLEPSNANLNLFRRTRVSAAAETNNPFTWVSTYAKVSGELPLSELPKYTVWNDTAPLTVLRFHLDVTTAGAAKLKFNSTNGLSIYLGNTPIEPKAAAIVNLAAGVQTVTVIVDRSKRTDELRIELDDVEKSPARVNVMGGK